LNARPLVVGQSSETAHRANLSAMLRELHIHGPLRRSELVTLTGLTRGTIGALVREFERAGYVTEQAAPSLGAPGRPSRRVRTVGGSAVVLALEVSVDSVAAATIGIGGEVIERVRHPRRDGRSSAAAVVRELHDLALRMTSQPLEDPNLIAIGVAIAGLVRQADGVVAVAPNMGWRNVRLGEMVARRFDTDVAVRVGNEADLGALAESRRGVAVGVRHAIYLGAEVGIGAGLIIDGEPLRGALGYGGEVGHMPLSQNGDDCRCGSQGCWETEAGQAALLTKAGRDPAQGLDGVLAVLADARAGDGQAMAALDDVGTWIGRGLATLINVLNPELVVLSGLFGRVHPLVAVRVERELDHLALPVTRKPVRVLISRLGNDGPLLGAAELGFEAFLVDPGAWLRRSYVPSSTRATEGAA
jgi:predicted NBD/HSP70 family sugar kinase